MGLDGFDVAYRPLLTLPYLATPIKLPRRLGASSDIAPSDHIMQHAFHQDPQVPSEHRSTAVRPDPSWAGNEEANNRRECAGPSLLRRQIEIRREDHLTWLYRARTRAISKKLEFDGTLHRRCQIMPSGQKRIKRLPH